MKLLAAAAFFALQAQSVPPAPAAPSEALVDRFIAAIPEWQDEAAETEIDAGELSRLAALNPGKEPQLRSILKANLACSGPAVAAVTMRMLRTIARELGSERLEKLIRFYEGPDYAAFEALATRMQGQTAPSAEDKAAMAKLMAAYPLQDFLDRMNRAPDMIAADQAFMTAAMKCASEQMEALEAAGLKTN